jgi:glycerol uptake facilitator-like aquaporin
MLTLIYIFAPLSGAYFNPASMILCLLPLLPLKVEKTI